MRIGLVYLKPRLVAYVRRTGPYRTSAARAWGELFAWIDRQGIRRQLTAGYGIAVDNPCRVSPDTCRYDACIELPADFPPSRAAALSVQTLPGGAFARMRHVGPYQNARTAITHLRDAWLGNQPNLILDKNRPVLIIYLDDPQLKDETLLKCDVCLPVSVGAGEREAGAA